MSQIIKGGTVIAADHTCEAEDILQEWAPAGADVVFHAGVDTAEIVE